MPRPPANNGELAQVFLSECGPRDIRPFIRFWNRLSYRRWLTLEDSVRLGRGVAGEFSFTPDEQRVFSERVEAYSAGQAAVLADVYDFSSHRRILDVGGGAGSFARAIWQRYPDIECTLYELPQAAAVARRRVSGTAFEHRLKIMEGDFLKHPLPGGHDAFLVANVVHVLVAEQNQQLFRRVRDVASAGSRLLLVDLSTNTTHTDPLFAAVMAGEFLVVGGNGDVYSMEEVQSSLEQPGWQFLDHKPLAGFTGLVVAKAAS